MFALQVLDILVQKGLADKIHKCSSVSPKQILRTKHV